MRRLDAQLADVALDERLLLAHGDEAEPGDARQHAHDDVLAHRQLRENAFRAAILGQEREPRANRARRVGAVERPAADAHRAAVRLLRAEYGLERFGAARAEQTGEPDDLLRRDAERHVAQTRAPAQPVDGERGLPRRVGGHRLRLFARAVRTDFAAEHRRNQRHARQPVRRLAAHHRAVAQHGEPVAHPVALRQPMAHQHDRDAGRAQLLDDAEQHLDFRTAQRGSRLVENQHARAERHPACDRHHLLLAEPERADLVGRIDVEPVALDDLAGARPHLAAVDPRAEAARLVTEEDVLGHAAFGNQVDFLVDRADARALRGTRAVERHGHAVDADLARIGLVKAGEDLDQRRLAGAVLAHQPVHLARAQRQRHAVQRAHDAERLADAVRFEHDGLAVGARVGAGSGGKRCVHRAPRVRG